ncbi:Elongation factor G, mitochondrial [Phlyctochytrium planicorne]|nr:Elongation factor G, mitochondrial [Phlyctochytrium planicorne]
MTRNFGRLGARFLASALPLRSLTTQKDALVRPFSSSRISLNEAAKIDPQDENRLKHLRNIGISAHIDSGKTTLTERILFYTGRIAEIHEVRGKDNVGAKMDSMELEREKGITIQSAATYAHWGNHAINIIDTPGHVDFTIEVERALRVLDGAILVLCAVGGVQVGSTFKSLVCLIIIRAGSNPERVIDQLKKKLRLHVAATQIQIGAEADFTGVVDLVEMKAIYNSGPKGETINVEKVPAELEELAKKKRTELIEVLADVDDAIAERFLNEEEPTVEEIKGAIRRATIERKFCPVFIGSAYQNKGVQALLDGVVNYLPSPHEVYNTGLDTKNDEQEIRLSSSSSDKLVGLAFKLEESRFGQLTYLRLYQGTLKKGDWIINARTGKRVKVPRLDVDSIGSGEICALFGVECASGDTFTDGASNIAMSSMFVPEPVISLSIEPKGKESTNFSKALNRFQREDPTFRVHIDAESKQTIISGMGELHLEIYVERMKREYNTECVVGKPQVAFRETITQKVPFNYTHKKQSGGSGQFGKVMGYIEPINEGEEEITMENEYVNGTVGMNIPSQFIPAIEKGFLEGADKGSLIGAPVANCRFVIEDGMSHAVDSSELAFKLAGLYAFREAYAKAGAQILEPIMDVSVTAPSEYQGSVIALLNKRKGTIGDSEVRDDYVEISSEVPLNDMFGFSTDLRSISQGKGEFSMQYKRHQPVPIHVQKELMEEYRKKIEARSK